MAPVDDEKELHKLYQDRLKDRRNFKSRRFKQVEAAPKRAAELISNYFHQDPEALRKIEQNRALMAWGDYVGESAARVSQALKIRGNQLVVRVSEPLWMQQLLLLKRELLRKYKESFPSLRLTDIYFTR